MTDRSPLAFAATLAISAFALACSSVAHAPPREARREPVPERAPAPARVAPAPEPAPAEPETTELLVTATAYNSLASQGVGRGKHGAWGDHLVPGMKTIAVSHDLIALGLTRGVEVRIDGLDGRYVVMDRLPKRWKRRIDIYMGHDVRAARSWGKRQVQIRWER